MDNNPSLEEDFTTRAVEYIKNNPVQAAPLNMLLQKSAKKRFDEFSQKLDDIHKEIEDEKNVDAPEAGSFMSTAWFIIKKIALLIIGVSAIVFTAYLMNSFMQTKLKAPGDQQTNQEIPANHPGNKGAE